MKKLHSIFHIPYSKFHILKSKIKHIGSNRKRRLIALGIILAIALPFVLNGLNYLKNAEAAWWQGSSGGSSWLKRERVPIVNNSTDSLAANTPIAITINTKELVNQGKLQSDCDDLRVLYQPDSSTTTELDRFVSYPGGGSCSTSEASKVYFKLQAALSSGSTSNSYYIYYGNGSASSPSSTDNAFDVGSKDALLVCPFDGSTTCAAGETNQAGIPGAIRYSGSKSVLNFDGIDDVVKYTTSSPISAYPFTLEAWVKGKNTSDTDTRVIVAIGDKDVSNVFYEIQITTTNVASMRTNNGSVVTFEAGTTDFDDGLWHHMAGVFISDTDKRLYVDGVLEAQETDNSTFSTAVDSLSVGENANGAWNFPGQIDEVRISNVARYTSNFTPSIAPFVRDEHAMALYHFDENGDDPRNAGKALDDSGNGNHGTITGAKYVSGLVGVDNGTTDTGKADGGNAYAGHEGIFIEEATTNKITNPSFEHSTYDTGWTAPSLPAISVVDSSASASGTSDSYQRKTWFDGARYWSSFYNEVNAVEFWYSTDGTNWTQNSSANLGCSWDFSIFADASRAFVVCGVAGADGNDLLTYNATSYPGIGFSWTNETTVFNGTSGTDRYRSATITQDTDGQIWIGTSHQSGAAALLKVIQSTNANDITAWGSATQIGTSVDWLIASPPIIVPLNAGDMYAVFGQDNEIMGCFYDEQTSNQWENSAGSACPTAQDDIGATANGLPPTVVADTTNYDVHLAWGSGSADLNYYRWDNGTGTNGTWQTAASVYNSGNFLDDVTISIDTDTRDLYITWNDKTTHDLSYSTCDVSAAGASECSEAVDWSSAVTIFDSLTQNNVFTNANYSGASRIFVEWSESNGNVKFKVLLQPTTVPSANTTAPYYKFGSKSAKLTGGGGFITSIDPNSTATHTLSAYVYNGTAGSIGGTVDGTVAKLVTEGTTQTTTYTDMGGGWWRLSYVDTSVADAAANWGVEVQSGKIIYLDGVQLEAKAYATTYTDGTLGTGYSWSGTAHESTSSRTAADLEYSPTSNISGSAGSVSFWAKSNGNTNIWNTSLQVIRYFSVNEGWSSDSIQLMNNSPYDGLTILHLFGANSVDCAITYNSSGLSASSWHQVVVKWNATGNYTYLYVDGSQVGANTTCSDWTAPNFAQNILVGGGAVNISDFRIYDTDIGAAEVTDLYYAGLVSHSDQSEVDAFSETKNQNPVGIYHFDESYGTSAHDSSTYNNDLTISGATWETQSVGINARLTRNLKFDGNQDYASRSWDRDFDFGTDPFSISGWFRHASGTPSAQQTILARYGSAGYKVYLNSSGYLCFGVDFDSTWSPSDSACGTTNYYDSAWHHFEAVKDATTLTLYVDGNQVGTDSSLSASTTLSSSTSLYIGIDSDGSSNDYAGYLDEIFFYPYARSASQVKEDILGSQTAVLYGSQAFDPFTQGLVGYWKMDETVWSPVDCTAYPVLDSSGNGEHGQACPATTGPTGGAVGKFGNSGYFDGSNDYIDLDAFNYLDGKSTVTVAAWIRPDFINTDASTHSIWGVANYSLKFNTNLDDFNITINATGGTASPSTTGLSWTQNSWHHIVATYDGTTGRIYWDGEIVATDTTSGALDPSGSGDHIGAASGINPWLGNLDEVRAYTRTLSPVEVKQLYNWAPGPVAHYKLDENTGETVYDSSGGGSNGDFDDTPTWTTGKFGSGVNFDGTGSDDRIYVAPNTPINNPTQMTAEAWIYPRSLGEGGLGRIFNKWASNENGRGFGVYTNNALVYWQGWSGSTDFYTYWYTANDSIVLNQWNHVVVTYDKSSSTNDPTFYINGVAQPAPTEAAGNPPSGTVGDDSTGNLYIGNRLNTGVYDRTFDGVIDDFRYYNYIRTPGQITEDMNAGHPVGGSPISSEIIHWKFDEGDGTTANNSNTVNPTLTGTANGTVWKFGSDCKISSCLDFDTTTDDVTAGDVSFIDGLTGFTTTFWLYLDNLTVASSLISKLTVNQNVFAFNTDPVSSSDIRAIVYETLTDATPGIYSTTGLGLTTGAWQHIAIVYDGTGATNADRIKVYRNGFRAATGSTSQTIPASLVSGSTSALNVGESDDARGSVDGKFDTVKMYNTALTDAQVMVDMNSGSAASFSVLATQNNEGFAGANPVGWWKNDEGTGTSTINDFSGSTNDLTMNNFESTDWAQYTRFAQQSYALTFDGSNEYLSRTDDDDFDFGTGDFSVSAWVKHNGAIATSDDFILTKADTTTGGYKLYMDPTGDLCFATDDDNAWTPDDAACTTGVDYDDSTWHHVVGVIDTTADRNKLYVDGILVSSVVLNSNSRSSNNALYVGMDRDGSTGGWDGQIDEVRIYNYALSNAQVAYHFNRSAPFAWYKLDECSGTAANNSAPLVSGGDAGYDGTITIGAGGGEDTIGDCSTSSTAWGNGATGKFNGSLDFDGTDDYIDIGDLSAFEPNDSGSFTIEAWVNRDSFTSIDVIASKDDDTGSTTLDGWFLTLQASDIIIFSLNDSTNAHTAATAAPNTITATGWNHIVAIYSNDTSNIYLNGVLAATGGGNLTNTVDNTVSVRIGSESDGGNPFDGKIDNVKFYNSYFTEDQVKKLYNEGRAVRFGPQTGSP